MSAERALPSLEGLTVWDAAAIGALDTRAAYTLGNLIDDFGRDSAVAQGLPGPITSCSRLANSTHTLYLDCCTTPTGRTQVLAGLKVGRKGLFLYGPGGRCTECRPLCVLDFYVHAASQRRGLGRGIFEAMLRAQGVRAGDLAYDAASPRLLSFLHKHFGLTTPDLQHNNFTIFPEFWGPELAAAHPGSPSPISTAPHRLWGLTAEAAQPWESIAKRPLTSQQGKRPASAARQPCGLLNHQRPGTSPAGVASLGNSVRCGGPPTSPAALQAGMAAAGGPWGDTSPWPAACDRLTLVQRSGTGARSCLTWAH